MKSFKNIVGILVFLLFTSVTAHCADPSANPNVFLEIDYGGLLETGKFEIPYKQGLTALEALQAVAIVKTHKIGEFTLVTSIDDIESKKGDTAWYYDINGKHATSVANKCILNKGDHICWKYSKDVCTPKATEGLCK